MTENQIGVSGTSSLSEALMVNSSITELNLGFFKLSFVVWSFTFSTRNKIGSQGTKALSEGLKINSSLTKLDMEEE